jgi:flagellar capping protein FliD
LKSTSSQENDNIKQELTALEKRLQTYIDKRFLELQQRIDEGFTHLEEKLTNLNR